MDSSELNALEPGELEYIIESSKCSDIKTVGSKKWIEWHHQLQKLQQQAVLETATGREELTKDTIISHGKIPLLLHEAICIGIWKQKIFPEIMKKYTKSEESFILYTILYHETVAAGLMEIILFDEEACCSMSDLLVDLIDYFVDQITLLIGLVNSGYLLNDEFDESKKGTLEDLIDQQKNLQFDIGIRSITIISCLANVLSKIHVSGAVRFYSYHDIPLLIVELIEQRPWEKTDKSGKLFRYIEGKWKLVMENDAEKICRAESLCWISLWTLCHSPEFGKYYEINNFRKTQLCKLIYRINDIQMDQIPLLLELKQTLGRLSVLDITIGRQAKCTPILIESLPQIKPNILKAIENQSSSIASFQIDNYFTLDDEHIKDVAKMLSSTYLSKVVEFMDDGGPKCAQCGDPAPKKCSRCKSEWYCGRECQVNRWQKHKEMCDKLACLNTD